jgi:hypothetical protein
MAGKVVHFDFPVYLRVPKQLAEGLYKNVFGRTFLENFDERLALLLLERLVVHDCLVEP